MLYENKHLLIMGGYCQWHLPQILDDNKISHKKLQQLDRLNTIISKWEIASKENKHMVEVMDNTKDINLSNSNHNNETLLGTLNDHLSSKYIVRHNYDNTRFMT